MKRSMFLGSLIALTVIALGLSACSGGGDVTVSDVRSNACAEGDACGIFMTIANDGDAADTLVGATSDVSDTCGLHTVEMDDAGEMAMVPIEDIPVPAAGSVELKPGSLHVMCMPLNRELAEGDTFPVTLQFDQADDVTLDVTVQAQN
ncbi:MAG: copper chaperone PCu(A)C [Actinomycetota bacterium]